MKIKETAYWVDELHLSEGDRNFSYESKPYNFDSSLLTNKVKYHQVKTDPLFYPPLPKQDYYNLETCTAETFDAWYWNLLSNNMGYYNEAVQRSNTAFLKEIVGDEDIIILSDLDEILDSRFADRIIDEVKKHQIVTVKLHFSVFYLNLFADRNHGAPDFSYRTFIMTGRYFKRMPFTADYLRKKGTSAGLLNTVHCIDDYMGFHHSWMQHTTNAFSKLKAFEANVQDKGLIRDDFAANAVRDKRLSYLNANLEVDNERPFLRGVLATNTEGMWYEE
ncbi:hypothetical protein [Chitinophaga nivalis]|uniref:Glycosyl transferase n=1 Tax=Chitinophaga nivalis TaxID=2991709 RepID=A0ABT3ILZ1_9BACT|nr:hypothetical protein [Chitinophaga nivalis]MCW3465321.1 hypothetical protein [Chitinophaga nivalis]MCW3484987.1 hypothetical protein [Chitinophaga nivalis]